MPLSPVMGPSPVPPERCEPPAPAPDKLADLVDFVALRFAQLRPEGDPSVAAAQLVQQYAFERSGPATRLHTIDADYSAGRAAAMIDRAYLSADGICDGRLEERRASASLAQLAPATSSRRGSNAKGGGRVASLGGEVAERVQRRMETARAGVELCSVHLRLISWLRQHSDDGAIYGASDAGDSATQSPRAVAPQPTSAPRPSTVAGASGGPSPPWRDVDTAPAEALLEECLDAAEACDMAPDPSVIEQSRCIGLIRRDIARVRRTLPLLPALRELGKDPSLKPANTVWATLLGLPEQQYEHQLVAAVRAFAVHKMCLGRVLRLLNDASDVRSVLSRHAEDQAAKEAEQRAQEQAAAAAAEKKRQEEERRAAAAATRGRKGK